MLPRPVVAKDQRRLFCSALLFQQSPVGTKLIFNSFFEAVLLSCITTECLAAGEPCHFFCYFTVNEIISIYSFNTSGVLQGIRHVSITAFLFYF